MNTVDACTELLLAAHELRDALRAYAAQPSMAAAVESRAAAVTVHAAARALAREAAERVTDHLDSPVPVDSVRAAAG